MDDTAHDIEAHIDRTREHLGANLNVLDEKVDAATDWRKYFRDSPDLFLGAAVVGGAMLATLLRATPSRSSDADITSAPDISRDPVGAGPATAHARDLWKKMTGALISVAGARIRRYIDEVVPGFEEHYRRAEQRASSSDAA